MRGGYGRQITEKPGTCGGCKHFERSIIGGRPTGTGKCRRKPAMWPPKQSMPACKKYYEEKEDET